MTTLHPKILLEGGPERAPTLKLSKALTQRHPDLFGRSAGANHATLRIIPRCINDHRGDCGHHVSKDGWYEVVHTYEAMEEACFWQAGSPDEEGLMPTYRRIGKPVAYLPPPLMRSVAERLAELPPITVTEADTQFFGSHEEAYRTRQKQREAAVKQDFSFQARDWEATADVFAEILHDIPALKLTALQRAEQADVRVYWADQEAMNARASRTGLRRNAGLEPMAQDLVGPPEEVIWYAMDSPSPDSRAVEPGAHGIEIPETVAAWFEAKSQGHPDAYLLVEMADGPSRPPEPKLASVVTTEPGYLCSQVYKAVETW